MFNNIDIYDLSGMYLTPYFGQIDVGSMFINFARAMSKLTFIDEPVWIQFTVSEFHFSLTAVGLNLDNKSLDAQNPFHGFSVLNIEETSKQPDSSLDLLRSIIWFSEYCFVEMSYKKALYRQSFFRGYMLPSLSISPLNTNLVNIHFTVNNNKIFHNNVLSRHRAKLALNEWNKFYSNHKTESNTTKSKPMSSWRIYDEHNYSFRLKI